MADEARSPAKKRIKTDKTGLDQKEESDTQQQSVKSKGKINKLTSIRVNQPPRSNNSCINYCLNVWMVRCAPGRPWIGVNFSCKRRTLRSAVAICFIDQASPKA